MFGYVVLHYQNIDITKKCIDALKCITTVEPIVVVDNCSPNKSGLELEKVYSSDRRVKIIINSKNEGFAAGNNLGYNYLINKYNLSEIVVMNNDVIINDIHFQEQIRLFMKKHKLDVCGPDIITPQKIHQNPLLTKPFSNFYIRKTILKNHIQLALFKSDLLFDLYLKYKSLRSKAPRDKQISSINCILHGSCIVFGENYIQNESFAFLPITFMYNEECILFDYLKFKDYRSGYCDKTTINHMEGASTSREIDNVKEKTIIRLKRNTESLQKQLLQRKKYI